MQACLTRSLSLPMLIALGAAGVLGTSWVYAASYFFARYGAGGEIFGLAAGGILAACVALVYAELAARFPRAGGEIVFAYIAFGRRVGFIAGWLLIGAYVSSLAFYVTASGLLLAILWPGLNSMPLYSVAGTEVGLPLLGIGILLTWLIWGFTVFGVRLAGAIQLLLFTAMVLIGLGLATVGFTRGSPANFWPAFAPHADPLASTLRFVLPAMTFLDRLQPGLGPRGGRGPAAAAHRPCGLGDRADRRGLLLHRSVGNGLAHPLANHRPARRRRDWCLSQRGLSDTGLGRLRGLGARSSDQLSGAVLGCFQGDSRVGPGRTLPARSGPG
jgi:hypothetical protein